MKEKFRSITSKEQLKTTNYIKRFIDWGGCTSGIGHILQGEIGNAILITLIIFVLAILTELYLTKFA